MPTIKYKTFAQPQYPEVVTVQELQANNPPCPYEHISIETLPPRLIKVVGKNQPEIAPGPLVPKIVECQKKDTPNATEKILQSYMKQTLEIFDMSGPKSSEWRQPLREISRKLSGCKVLDPTYESASGLSLPEFANEVQKAVTYLKLKYRLLQAELFEADRALALNIFEQHLLQILHKMKVAVHLGKPAAILEQKWRTYFLVNLAQDRFAPLNLEDHQVFGRFCQIYSLAYANSSEWKALAIPEHDDKLLCAGKWKEAFLKFEHSIFGQK